jgi:uracil-DNA glycosylase family 4
MRRTNRRLASPPATLEAVRDRIIACNRCARLRRYCLAVAREKRAAYRDWEYWAKPVPGFGDPDARVLILGLAPAAHGANRTGRVFTGDGVGGSGDFLMGALHRAGFANIPTSRHPDDGLVLRDVFIAAAVRCAPPGNKPTAEEIAGCLGYLEAEVRLLPRLEVVVALGKVAWDAWLQLVARFGDLPRPRPAFGHGAVFTPVRPNVPHASTRSTRSTRGTWSTLIGCYHPSRQNTNTGKVTSRMYDDLLGRQIRRYLARLATSD